MARKASKKSVETAAAGVEQLDVDQLLNTNFEEIEFDVEPSASSKSKSKSIGSVAKSNKREAGKAEHTGSKRDRGVHKDMATSQPTKRRKPIKGQAQAIARVEGDTEDEAEQDSLRDTVSSHKADLQALREQDPQFYEYLKEADKDLLAFGNDLDSSGSDADELGQPQDEDDNTLMDQRTKHKAKQATTGPSKALQDSLRVTEEVAANYCEAAKATASVGAVHQLMRLYRAACHYSDSEQSSEAALQITSSRAFNKIMMFTLAEADGLLRRMLGVTDPGNDKSTDVTQLPRWRKVETLVKSYLGNTLHMLGTMTNAGMQAFVLRRLRSSVVFLRPFEKLTRKLLKAALSLFGMAGDQSVNTQAILFVRQMALVLPQPALDNCLKGVTRTFSAYSKFSSATSSAHLAFMATCIVELFSMDEAASYSHAFNGIKDLAVTLRGALTMKSVDAFRAVYCWQTVRGLELWARVITELGPQSELRALVYPLVQILLGSARLVPAPRYFPLRLRLAAALHRVAESAGVLVPLAPLLLEMLTWSDLCKPPQTAAGQAPDLRTSLRVSPAALRTAAFQEDVVSQVLQLLAAHLAQWATSIAAPEIAHLPTLHLRALAKSLPAERFRSQVKALLAAIERNSVWVGRQRDAVEFSPKDISACEAFLAKERAARQAPLQVYADLLTKRLQKERELRDAQQVDLPRAGGASHKRQADSSDADDGPSQHQQPSRRSIRPQQHSNLDQQASREGGKFVLAEEADHELVADYQLSDDDEDDSDRPPNRGLFAAAVAVDNADIADRHHSGGSGASEDDVMDGDFESDPEGPDDSLESSPTEQPRRSRAVSGKQSAANKSKRHTKAFGGSDSRKALRKGAVSTGDKGKSRSKQRRERKH